MEEEGVTNDTSTRIHKASLLVFEDFEGHIEKDSTNKNNRK